MFTDKESIISHIADKHLPTRKFIIGKPTKTSYGSKTDCILWVKVKIEIVVYSLASYLEAITLGTIKSKFMHAYRLFAFVEDILSEIS